MQSELFSLEFWIIISIFGGDGGLYSSSESDKSCVKISLNLPILFVKSPSVKLCLLKCLSMIQHA